MYITYKAVPHTRQISFDEIISGIINPVVDTFEANNSTVTRWVDRLPDNLPIETEAWIKALKEFNTTYADLEASDLSTHYRHFEIPKKSGGLRPIDAPDDELKKALKILKELLKGMMIADHHNCAYAYIEQRSHYTAVARHQYGHVLTKQENSGTHSGTYKQVKYENNWSVKFDFHGFFPSTTIQFVLSMLRLQYPFCLIMKSDEGYAELKKALRLAFLNGGLPQGTPFSPWITNVMMIPFDAIVSKKLYKLKMKDGKTRYFTYTRYADDITISSYQSFDPMEIQETVINAALKKLNAPFALNSDKTHYGNRHSSKNWCLGLQWNADNQVTVGWRNLKTMKATITAYLLDKKKGVNWPIEDVQKFNGTISYYRMIEKDTVDGIIERYNAKYGMDLMGLIRADLKAAMA